MKNQIVLKNEAGEAPGSDTILKATALLYLQEALLKEEYEECQELIDLAQKFGAPQSEIDEVLAGYLQDKFGSLSGARLTKSRFINKGGK